MVGERSSSDEPNPDAQETTLAPEPVSDSAPPPPTSPGTTQRSLKSFAVNAVLIAPALEKIHREENAITSEMEKKKSFDGGGPTLVT